MKTITKLALIVAIASFAIVANAQTLPGTTGTPAGAVNPGIDSAVVDWVTVGAVMPYRTTTSAASFDLWTVAVTDAFGGAGNLPTHMPTFRTTWSVNGSDITNPLAPTRQDSINFHWDVLPGRYELLATTEILLNGNPAGCEPAVRGKLVYVLPEPTARLHTEHLQGTGSRMVIGCNAPSHTVNFQISGVGVRQARYTVTRRAMDGTETGASTIENFSHGTAMAVAVDFRESNTDWDGAMATANARSSMGIEVTSLEPGFIYTVRITGVSDQISRKSKVGPANDGFVVPTDIYAVFAVIPEPTGTRIEHITNIGH
jgi:hypothetical protein